MREKAPKEVSASELERCFPWSFGPFAFELTFGLGRGKVLDMTAPGQGCYYLPSGQCPPHMVPRVTVSGYYCCPRPIASPQQMRAIASGANVPSAGTRSQRRALRRMMRANPRGYLTVDPPQVYGGYAVRRNPDVGLQTGEAKHPACTPERPFRCRNGVCVRDETYCPIRNITAADGTAGRARPPLINCSPWNPCPTGYTCDPSGHCVLRRIASGENVPGIPRSVRRKIRRAVRNGTLPRVPVSRY